MRTFVFGDIHGGLKALLELIDKIKATEEDQLIFLGDYVDGWGESAQVIDFLVTLDRTHNCIFIKGNHDIWCKEWLKTGHANPIWLFHGGQSTVESYESMDALTRLRHLNFIESMPLFHISKDNDLFIHAGFTSMHGPKRELYNSNYNWDRTLWEMAISLDKTLKENSPYYPRRLKLFREIYIGHTPTFKFGSDTPMHAANLWNVDTGAAFKGRLSCMDLDTKEFYQSTEVYKLYPDEKGRNKD